MRLILTFLLTICFCRPAELDDICASYIESCQSEVSAPEAGEPCSSHLGLLNACDATEWTKENYWQCVRTQFEPVRADLSKTAQFMEACFYEEHKDLTTYSYYANKIPSEGIEGLDDTTFTFSEDEVTAGDSYMVGIHLDWPESVNAVPSPVDHGCDGVVNCTGGGFIDPFIVWHINLHACLLSETQTTCSIKYPAEANIVSALNLQGFSAKGMKGESFEPMVILTEPGDYKLLGHIRYYVEDENSELMLWDIGMTKQLTVGNATTTTREPNSGTGAVFSLAAAIVFFFGFM